MNLEGLQTRHLEMKQASFNDIKAFAAERLDAVIYQNGNLYLKGNPTVTNIVQKGKGRVISN